MLCVVQLSRCQSSLLVNNDQSLRHRITSHDDILPRPPHSGFRSVVQTVELPMRRYGHQGHLSLCLSVCLSVCVSAF